MIPSPAALGFFWDVLGAEQSNHIKWTTTSVRSWTTSLRHHHQSLNREGRWGTTYGSATSFLHFFPCFPLPSGICRTPGLSIPWCCLPTSSSVCLVLFPLSLYLARWFWLDPMNGRQDYTTAVCVSLRSLSGLRVVKLLTGSWHGLSRW